MRSMKMLMGLGVVLTVAMTAACDSPGGGTGGGGTSCATNPNQPGCQAADASNGQDTTAGTDGGACVPQCAGKQCGADGCGGICGTCASGGTCDQATGTCGTTTVDPTSCRGVMLCVNGCTDAPCVQACLGSASATANQQLAAINSCEDSFGCDDSLCESEHCADQLAACSFEGSCGSAPGDCLSCKQIVACRDTSCGPDDLACISACGAQGGVNAKAPAMRMILCLDGACGGDKACEQAATDPGELCHDAWLACDDG